MGYDAGPTFVQPRVLVLTLFGRAIRSAACHLSPAAERSQQLSLMHRATEATNEPPLGGSTASNATALEELPSEREQRIDQQDAYSLWLTCRP